MSQCRVATVLSLGLALLMIVSASPAWAGNATPKVYGRTIGNWGHAWWQWGLNFPAVDNPIVQTGDVDCSAGQSGKVWFLAGTFGETAERTCSIKRGKAIFFPLLNGLWWAPEDCADEQSCRTGVSESIDAITSWTCTVDDIPCVWLAQVVRAQSDPLPFNIPEGSIATEWGYDPGVRELSVADGYWVMLNPLRLGRHTIRFTSSFPDFALDVTYRLLVVP